MTEVYDTQTGAKLLDKSYTRKIEDDDLLYEDDLYYDSTNQPGKTSIHVINEALKAIVTDMGEQICEKVVLQPWRGYITSTFAEKVVVSSGENVGIRPGDIFDVYDCDSIVKGAEKHRFFVPGLKIGEIKITDVYPEHAEGVFSSGQNIHAGCSISPKD